MKCDNARFRGLYDSVSMLSPLVARDLMASSHFIIRNTTLTASLHTVDDSRGNIFPEKAKNGGNFAQ